MKKLQDKVNIIPVIAKSDTITKAELAKFKTKVMAEIKANNIRLYQFPTDDDIVSEINENTNVSIICYRYIARNCSFVTEHVTRGRTDVQN